MAEPVPAVSPQPAVALGDHLCAVHAGLRRDLAAIRDRLADPEVAEISSLPNDLLSHCVAFGGALQQHLRYAEETLVATSNATDPATLWG
ncbi:hypothetical protein [Nocardia brasiliensis]